MAEKMTFPLVLTRNPLSLGDLILFIIVTYSPFSFKILSPIFAFSIVHTPLLVNIIVSLPKQNGSMYVSMLLLSIYFWIIGTIYFAILFLLP